MNSLYKKRVFLQPFKCYKNTRHGAGGGTRTHPHNSINVDKSRLFSVVVNFVVNLCVFQHTDCFLYRHVLRLAAGILEHILKLLDSVFRTVGAAVPSAAVPSIAGGKAPHTVAASAIAVAAHVTLCVPFAGTAVAIGHHDFVDVLDAVYKLVDDIECAWIQFALFRDIVKLLSQHITKFFK